MEAGSITQILPETPQPCDDDVVLCNPIMKVRRVYMYTYYVDDSNGVPRLMRAVNQWPPTALAGVIEDLDLSYDLVDGVVNPTEIDDLPFTADDGATYAASQIRKVNVHVGVRSEDKSTRTKDYLRNHLSTVISLRNLAYVDRYE